jgi:hypothetical protein
MTFIRTILAEEAEGKVKEMYDADIKGSGYIANGTKAMSLRPDAFLAWEALRKTVRSKMRLRRYELVTLATASALHCTY